MAQIICLGHCFGCSKHIQIKSAVAHKRIDCQIAYSKRNEVLEKMCTLARLRRDMMLGIVPDDSFNFMRK